MSATLIKTQINYSPEKFQEVYRIHFRHIIPFKGKLLMVMGLLLIATGILLIVANRATVQFNLWTYLFIPFYGVLLILFQVFSLRGKGKRIYNRMKDLGATGHGLEVSDEAVTFITPEGQFDIEWEKFMKAIITPRAVLLYFGRHKFYPFTADDFNAGDFENFSALVAGKVRIVK